MKLLRLRPRSALREFLRNEASGGLLLIAASAAALIVANSSIAPYYFEFLNQKLGPLSLLHWVNDVLMALFFLLVGLEIKREMTDGHLASWGDRSLPMIAAAAGMIVPAAIYLLVARGDLALAKGWAIPAATDIAFAIAVLAMLGSRAPASLKLFLTTVAIVDDMGAVGIIALAYTNAISGPALLAALFVMAGMFTVNRMGVKGLLWYFLGFAALWLAVFQSGVHATVAGVIAALFVPVRVTKATPDAEDSTLHQMEHVLHKPVAWMVVPLFGFANAGVTLGEVSAFTTLPLAVAMGLFFGKQIGIFGSVWMAVKLGIAQRPAGASWPQIYGVSLLCGIGFTMSLFIGGLAFDDATLSDGVKIGVLMGSIASALCGWLVLRVSAPQMRS